MIHVSYTETDGPRGRLCRLEAAGHAGYAPAGHDIVCAGASTLMQTLVYLLAAEKGAHSDAWADEDGPHLVVTAAPLSAASEAAFGFVKAGFGLLAERYPEYVRFADESRRGQRAMVNLQLFAEGEGGEAPALSRAQAQQAVASGTMRPAETHTDEPQPPASTPQQAAPPEQAPAPQPARPALPPLPPRGANAVQALHARWAAEEAAIRREQPGFSFSQELRDPEMRRLMQLPGMRMQDAYRLAHYGETIARTAQTVEQGVVERIRQRGARPAENGTRTGAAAVTGADVAHMTRAQREALERQALHGMQIRF